MKEKSLFWADQVARKIISEKGKKKVYTCAAGITPSGTIHIGNFREIITVDLIVRALQYAGVKTRFIYSWDDYDRLRKIPENIPNKDLLEKFMFKAIVDVPDPWNCHKSYADHFEKELEENLPEVGINPEFIRQSEMYRKCAYASQIKDVLEKKEIVRKILNKYRKDPLPKDWYPLRVYCQCGSEETKVLGWNGDFKIKYSCKCGHEEELDFRKKGNVKLPWRIDWPMRWHYENVDFEPGGKEHSTPGGSRTTGEELQKTIWNTEPPIYMMYDYIILSSGGKMSSSKGNVITLNDVLKVYLPEIVRYMFAGTKPRKEFTISFGEDIIKVYEDFYKTERIYFGKEKVNDKQKMQSTRIYEMSCINKPAKKMPIQPGFKHCVTLINIYRNVKKALKKVEELERISRSDSDRYRSVLERAKNWVELYAPDKYKFSLREDFSNLKVSKKEKEIIKDLVNILSKKTYKEDELYYLFKKISDKHIISTKDFFQLLYRILINKNFGPRLNTFIVMIGQDKIVDILKNI